MMILQKIVTLQKKPCMLSDMVRILNQLRRLKNKVHTCSQLTNVLGKCFLIWFSSLGSYQYNTLIEENFICPTSNPYLSNSALGKAGNPKSKNDRSSACPWRALPIFPACVFIHSFSNMKLTVAGNNWLTLFLIPYFPSCSFYSFCLRNHSDDHHSFWWPCVCCKDNSTWNCKRSISEGLKHSTTSQWMGGDRNSLNICLKRTFTRMDWSMFLNVPPFLWRSLQWGTGNQGVSESSMLLFKHLQ